MPCRHTALAMALLAPQAVWADLAISYKLDFQVGPVLPPAIVDAVRQQVAGAIPGEMAMRAKAGKCTSSIGPLNTIIDSAKGEITLLNPKTKQFATTPTASYADKIASSALLPPAAKQMLANLKVDVQTSKTGQTGSINDILAEETLITLTIEGPDATTSLRIDMDEWLPAASEFDRVPALKELGSCPTAAGMTDPSAMLDKLFGQLPGASAKLSEAMKALSIKGSAVLEMQIAAHAPGLGALLQSQGAPGVDPDAPLVLMQMNLAELSFDSLPDTLFQVPAGYQEAPIEDLLKTVAPATRLAQAQPPVPPYTGSTFRPGGDVSAPVPTFHPEPKYTEEARKARIEGSVMLSLVVDPDGNTRNIKVVKSLDPGLDQKAIEAVSQWKFNPGKKSGTPVAIQAQIAVTFRLLDKAPNDKAPNPR